MDSIAIGKHTEQLARDYLQQHGLTHKESNYRCRQGEIDLVMEDHQTLVFVEVRYRKSQHFGSAAESIDSRKQSKLVQSAKHYLTVRKKLNQACRFDVISLNGPLTAIKIDWIKNAFMS